MTNVFFGFVDLRGLQKKNVVIGKLEWFWDKIANKVK